MDNKYTKWTNQEIQKLIEIFPDKYNTEIAKELNKSLQSIQMKALRLGLHKSKKHRSAHIAKRNKMVGRDINEQLVRKESLLYKSKAEFQRRDGSCYIFAREHGILDEVCSHMLKMSYSIPQLILKNIMNILLKKKCLYNDRKTIKPYELDVYYPEYKLAFEYNGKGWHQDNNSDDIKKRLCDQKDIKLIIITENNRRYEEDVKNQLILNLKHINEATGNNFSKNDIENIVIGNIFEEVYDKNGLIKLAKSYESFKEFKQKHINEYDKIVKLKIIDECFEHMEDKRRYHTLKSVQQTISKYEYLLDLIQNDYGTYLHIKRNKLDYLIAHLQRK